MDREVVVQSLGAIQPFVTPWKAAHQVSLSFTISQNFLKLLFIESVILSNLLILCCSPLLLSSIFPSIKVFSNKSALQSGSQSVGTSASASVFFKEYSGLISLRMDWLDLLAAQGTLKSLLQHHSSKASNLQHSAFLMVQVPHLCMTTVKTIALYMFRCCSLETSHPRLLPQSLKD